VLALLLDKALHVLQWVRTVIHPSLSRRFRRRL
jgi:hypothetical protein